MKPTLTYIVSGTFALLVTFTLTFTPRSAQASRPDGYTDSGQPYYYAYPDEGPADEESPADNSDMTLQMPPDQSMPQSSEYGYDDSYVEPYYGIGGGWLSYGALNGNPNGIRNGHFNNHRHFGPSFSHQGGMHHNLAGHSSMVPMAKSSASGARIAGGAGRGGGGGHR